MAHHILQADCLVAMRALIAEGWRVQSIVCDPPYGLEFMGKDWDGADGFRRSLNAADAGRDSVFGRSTKRGPEYRTTGAGRIGKPGIGDRDTAWVSNQGWNAFRCASCGHLFHGGSPCRCAEPQPVRADNRWNLYQEWCQAWAALALQLLLPGGHLIAFGAARTYHRLASAIEDAGFEIRDQLAWVYGSGFPKSVDVAKAINKAGGAVKGEPKTGWQGWGTALKPAWEPICLARKPLEGTVAANVLKYGVGGLHIDACRIGWPGGVAPEIGTPGWGGPNKKLSAIPDQRGKSAVREAPLSLGRFPANLVHDGSDEVLACFPETHSTPPGNKRPSPTTAHAYGDYKTRSLVGHTDSGSAARFFYHAKASKADRLGFDHPTIKPVNLMRWLVRLVTPPGGMVLDPFAGTGTTGAAAYAEGCDIIMIEREPAYCDNIRTRMALCAPGPEAMAAE